MNVCFVAKLFKLETNIETNLGKETNFGHNKGEFVLDVKLLVPLMCPPLSFDHRNIKINNTDKPSLHTCLFTGVN